MNLDFINVDDNIEILSFYSQLLMPSFVNLVKQILSDGKNAYIVVPYKTNIESYAFDLESILDINCNQHSKIHYIRLENILEELPTFLDNVVMDPRCVINQLNTISQKLNDIQEVIHQCNNFILKQKSE